MNRFSIKDIENLTGIKAHTLRIWEQRYGLLQPKRTPTNIRYYDSDDLRLALRIALLNQYGYKISRINRMNEAEMNALVQKISEPAFVLQARIHELIDSALAMDTRLFEQQLDAFINRHGLEEAVENLMFPWLQWAGVLWMTGMLLPAQEHLASHIMYRKIILAIENIPLQPQTQGPSMLLFLPEGETHDLPLLYVAYLLRKSGGNALYLGPNCPLEDARTVYEARKPQFIYLHLTAVTQSFDARQYFQKLSAAFPDALIFVTGSMLRHVRINNKNHGSNIRQLSGLREVKLQIEQLGGSL